uniref:HEAT repeat-containing protein 1 n=1 Tax=Elaeophora elaphi TaxID=1147741 RepID=A0A0R3RQY5_9BILA
MRRGLRKTSTNRCIRWKDKPYDGCQDYQDSVATGGSEDQEKVAEEITLLQSNLSLQFSQCEVIGRNIDQNLVDLTLNFCLLRLGFFLEWHAAMLHSTKENLESILSAILNFTSCYLHKILQHFATT